MDAQWGETVKAIVVVRPGMTATAEELIAFCRGQLGGFERPRSVDMVAELPRNPSGKVLKWVLREPTGPAINGASLGPKGNSSLTGGGSEDGAGCQRRGAPTRSPHNAEVVGSTWRMSALCAGGDTDASLPQSGQRLTDGHGRSGLDT